MEVLSPGKFEIKIASGTPPNAVLTVQTRIVLVTLENFTITSLHLVYNSLIVSFSRVRLTNKSVGIISNA